MAIVASVLSLWLGLELAFRSWKARYQARAEFGATKVAPMVDPLARLEPPGVDPLQWRSAVADTHAMLVALTGSGVLDETQMGALRREIAARVALARPGTARETLAALWDDLESRAGPVIAPDRTPPPPNSRHAARHPRPPRPAILGRAVKKVDKRASTSNSTAFATDCLPRYDGYSSRPGVADRKGDWLRVREVPVPFPIGNSPPLAV